MPNVGRTPRCSATFARIPLASSLLAHFLFTLAILSILVLSSRPASAQITGEPVYFDGINDAGDLFGDQDESYDAGAYTPATPPDITITPQVRTERDNGLSANRVDFVFVPEGFTALDQPLFTQKVWDLTSAIFSEYPFTIYQKYFNVHRVHANSPQSGVSNELFVGDVKQTALGGEFWCYGAEHTLCIDVGMANAYGAYARDVDHIIVVANSAKKAGSAYAFSDLALVSGEGPSVSQNLLHQLGHSFGNLADEFDTGSWADFTGLEPAEPNASMLNAASLTTQKVKWYRWLGHDGGAAYGGKVGSYEGAMGSLRRIFRPTLNSKMRDIDQPFNNPSLESIIIEIYKLVNPIDDASPAIAGLTGSNTLSVKPMEPVGHSLSIQWYANGVAVPGATGKTFRPNDYPLVAGSYQFSVKVIDNTPLVRNEEARSRYMTGTRTWTVAIDQKLPLIVTHPISQTRVRGEIARFGVQATGEDLKYQWFKDGVAMSGATGTSINVEVTSLAQNNSKYWVAVSNIAGTVVSNQAVLTVANLAPVLKVPSELVLVRGETQFFIPSATDPDGDPLSFQVSILPQAVSPGAFATVSSNRIFITAGSTHIGRFNCRLTAFDGLAYVSVDFPVSVQNAKPTLGDIADQRMHRRAEPLVVPLTVADADSGNIQLTATAAAGAVIRLSFTGQSLVIDPDVLYAGETIVTVTASDELSSVSDSFKLTVYDNAPTLVASQNQDMPWSEDFRELPLVASEPDGDALEYSFTVTPFTMAYDLDQRFDFRLNPDGWNFNLLGLSERYFKGILRESGQTATFFILPDGKLYEGRGSVSESILLGQFPVAYYHDPRLLFDVPAPVAPTGFVSLQGNKLILNPTPGYRGSFVVTPSVSDGFNYAVHAFNVTVYDAVPTIRYIVPIKMHWRETRKDLPISYFDLDGDPNGGNLTLSARFDSQSQARALDQEFNFRAPAADLKENALGRDEKYLEGSDKTTGSWIGFYILANGDLYRFGTRTGAASATFVASINRLYHYQTVYLIDMPLVAPEPIVLTLNGSTLTIDPPDRWTGFTEFLLTAQSGNIADVQNVALHVADFRPLITDNTKAQAMKYRGGFPSLTLDAREDDTADKPEIRFGVFPGTRYEAAWKLDQLYRFTLTAPDVQYNKRGWRERYVQGTYNGAAAEFFVLPNGELYRFTGTILGSPFVQALGWEYYADPRLLTRMPRDAAPPAPPQFESWIDANTLYLQRFAGNIGTPTLTATVFDGYSYDFWDIQLGMFNTPPAIDPIDDKTLHWKQSELVVPFATSDVEQDPLTITVTAGSEALANSLDKAYDFLPPSGTMSENYEGYKERYFKGTKNVAGQTFWFFILPDGRIYEHSKSVSLSRLLGQLSPEYYNDPGLLVDAPPSEFQPLSVSVEGNQIKLRQIAQGWLGSTIVTLSVSDGLSTTRETFKVTIYNRAPVIEPIPAQDHSHLPGTFTYNIVAADADNEPLLYSATLGTVLHIAHALDQQYNFDISSATYDFNKDGWREKSIRGYVQGVATRFAVLPNGELYRWNGSIAASTLIAHLSDEYYADPMLLVNVLAPATPPTLPVQVSGNRLTIQYPTAWKGAFDVLVKVTDGNLYDIESFRVVRSNHAPVVKPIPTQKIHWRTNSFEVVPEVSDADGMEQVTMSASVGDLSTARTLDSAHDFFMPNGGVIFNRDNMQEKLIQGTRNTAQYYWYAILPNGDIYDYRNRMSMSVKIGNLDPSFYEDPTMLVDISRNTFIPARVTVASGKIVIDPEDGWLGSFPVAVSATDGENTTRTSFLVVVENTVPAIKPSLSMTAPTAVSSFGYNYDTAEADVPDRAFLTHFGAVGGSAHLAYTLRQRYQLSVKNASYDVNALGWREKSFKGVDQGVTKDYLILPNGDVRERKGAVSTSPSIGKLPKTYYDNPLLLLSATDLGTLPAVAITSVGGKATLALPAAYQGTFRVMMYVFDGRDHAIDEFDIRVSNFGPDIISPADDTFSMHWRTDYIDVPINAVDADNDPLTLTARQWDGDLIRRPVTYLVMGKSVRVNPVSPFVGKFRTHVTATDGQSSDSAYFYVNVTNTDPKLETISTVSVPYGTPEVPIPLKGSDADGDPLTYRGIVSSADGAGVTVDVLNQTTLRARIPADRSKDFELTAFTTDGLSEVSQKFLVKIENAGPVISAISNISLPWRTTEHFVPFTASDPNGNPLSLSTVVLSTDIGVQASLANSSVRLSLPTKNVGSARVAVRATDGALSAERIFTVNVVNAAPKFNRIEQQFVPLGEPSLEVDILAIDPDNDPLTYTAQIVPAAQVAYQLDQVHNFELRFGDFFYDLLGLQEKYIQGTKNSQDKLFWYVIFPDGRFFEWTGALSTSYYYGRLPMMFYQDPTKLFDVANPGAAAAPATFTLNGSTLKLFPTPNIVGEFLVRARVTDTKLNDLYEFVVDVFDPDAPGENEDPSVENCVPTTELHKGEFTKSVHKSSFTVEGRVGDTAANPGSRTHELSVSRSAAGPCSQGETANYVWPREQVVPFKLEFNGSTKALSFELDGVVVRHNASVDDPLTDLLIRTHTTRNGANVALWDLLLDGQPIDGDPEVISQNGKTSVLQITSGSLDDGFTLEGKVAMKYELGPPPAKDSEVSFQIIGTSIEGHSSLCENSDSRKVTICHFDGKDRGRTLTIARSALSAHLAEHGDFIGACPGTPVENPDNNPGICLAGPGLQTPVYSQWNSTLNMRNVLELMNRGSSALPVRISLYSILGELIHQQNLTVPGSSEKEVVINDLSGFVPDSQGLVKLEFNGPLDGRMIMSRAHSSKAEYEFKYAMPLTNGLFGETSVSFNTTQPSTMRNERANIVMNWLSITNLDNEVKRFRVNTFNRAGRLLSARTVDVEPLTRMNLDGGHNIAGPRNSGTHVVTPIDLDTHYLAELTRFGGNSPSGTNVSEYKFAFPLTARLPQSDREHVLVTREEGETSWLEIASVINQATRVVVSFYNERGTLVEAINLRLPAYGQTVINTARYMKLGESGFAQVTPTVARSIVTNSVVYYTSGKTSGSVSSAYSALSTKASVCSLTGGFDLASSTENWLQVSNPSDSTVLARVYLQGASQSAERTIRIGKKSSVLLPIHNPRQFRVQAGGVGLLWVKSESPTAGVFSQLVRLKRNSQRFVDESIVVPMR